jgi:ubiquinone/menaquinone biosynthesis C-methylase UbiE
MLLYFSFMISQIIARFQQYRWNHLGKLNPDYFVWSTNEYRDHRKFFKSGERDVKHHIINDSFIRSKLTNLRKASILEVGCGSARMTKTLAKHFKFVYGIDISESMIQLANDRLKDFNNVSLFKTLGNTFPIQNSSVDLVFSYIVLQHVPSRKIIKDNIKEAYRVLRPNGVIKIQVRGVPASGGYLRFFKWFYGVNFNEEEIENVLNSIGFQNIRIVGENTKSLWVSGQK